MAGSRRPTKSRPGPGEIIGERYTLEALIATGGMGSVYRAKDAQTGGLVAIKVLRPELSREPDIRRRFARERTVLKQLMHPATVRIIDLGPEDAPLLFFVMELLVGETLHARLLVGGALDAEATWQVLEGTAAALQEAHGQGVIHGDLKPANLFLLSDAQAQSRVKVLDFGLSKIVGLERLTRTGDLSGTPHYMAPELLTGRGELDKTIDIYALGVILYRCLAGQLPFSANIPGKLMMDIVMGEAIPLAERCPNLGVKLRDVVMKAMARSPQLRHQSAGELVEAFDRALRA